MKLITSQLMEILQQQEMRRNVRALLKHLAVLACFIAVYSVGFHLLMLHEGQEHTWLTGVYWTLTVMSTLGFGDITFHTDLGRVFSIMVLLTGIVLLLIVLPFAFIRYFYAPWLKAQLRVRAPRKVGPKVTNHVIISRYDAIAETLIGQLRTHNIEYVVLEPDATEAVSLHGNDVKVLVGEPDNVDTWHSAAVERARLVVANLDDVQNTNVTLTVRELNPAVPVAAFAEDKDAVDILELSGADQVDALKHRLGQHLAAHTSAGTVSAHPIGKVGGMEIAEFLVRRTGLVGSTIRDSQLREQTGLNIVACLKRGQLVRATPEVVLTDDSIIVVVGTDEQIDNLDKTFVIDHPNDEPVVVIGGGKVGRAAIRALAERGVRANVIEAKQVLKPFLEEIANRVVIGRAEDLRHIQDVGIERAPSVLLTTHDDAMNIYLAIYCRRLNHEGHIVSRVTHERNLDSLHRAGANFVLSESSLGAKLLMSFIQQQELVVLGEDIDVFTLPVPSKLAGLTLAKSEIGSKTGLNVIGVQYPGEPMSVPAANTKLTAGTEIVLLGTRAQLDDFRNTFDA